MDVGDENGQNRHQYLIVVTNAFRLQHRCNRCCWQNNYVEDFFLYVSDFFNVKIGYQHLKKVTNILNSSPTTFGSNMMLATSVTNIGVAKVNPSHCM